ncbi:MarR family winged helix-turn-helix transcriptional regulator [Paenibacillus roseipurpureus]|uniref:MarR family transcriptional regulator n=1 Tax=Paenibacillus roseopurpureus TaxID=2918901 RepID=A0AA96LSR9_9BACL|nr:MarR family transcriptional regulator [Paenibacillus sp. MBLB1832]WNR45399.1 MarR family transcriptional regulator [Paenibacillus sp. MBLB1832]
MNNKTSTETSRNLAVLIWLRTIRITQKISRMAEQPLKELNVTGPQLSILNQLAASEGMSQQDIAKRLAVTKGNVSQLIDKLEEAGYIRKKKEGRSSFISLSDPGRRFIASTIPEHDQFIEEKFSVLTELEKEELLRLLRKVDQSL